MALSAKQRLFVQEYLIDKNATRAAKAAGYSKKTAHSCGPRLMENVEVKNAIDAALEKALIKSGSTAERVLAEIADIAFTKLKGKRKSSYGLKWGDKLKCLEMLAKYHKLLTDKTELTGANGAALVFMNIPENDSELKDDGVNDAKEFADSSEAHSEI